MFREDTRTEILFPSLPQCVSAAPTFLGPISNPADTPQFDACKNELSIRFRRAALLTAA